MKGEIIYKILNSLADAVVNQIDFTNAILKAGYGGSAGKIRHNYSKLQNRRITLEIGRQRLENFRKYLSKLKKEGLVLENNSKQIYLSDKGKRKLNSFQNSFSLNKDSYKKEIGNKVIVISYDIPIAFNRERNILRDMLVVLGFSLVHKSVWVGKVLLPARFISDLNRLGIMDYVEILEVTKTAH